MRRNTHGNYNIALEDDEDDANSNDGGAPVSFTAPTFAMHNDHTPQQRNRGRVPHRNGSHDAAAATTTTTAVAMSGDGSGDDSTQRRHYQTRNGAHAIMTVPADRQRDVSSNGSSSSVRHVGGSSDDRSDDNSDDNDVNDDDEDMPSVLAISRSNIPGRTPQELLAEHRKSIAEFSRRPEGALDLHSITLSRNQIEPDVPYVQCPGSMSSGEMQAALSTFTFGEPTSQQHPYDNYHDGVSCD